MTFTKKLNILLKERGMTRGQLAEATGIPYNTIVGFYTRGYKNMKLSNLRRLAAFFQVSMDLLSDDERELDEEKRENPEMLKKYQTLSSQGKSLVDHMIDGILDIERAPEPGGEEAPEDNVVYIREYVTPAAAGYASPAEGEDYRLIVRAPSAPADADFAVRIAGDSMEPYIRDGSSVYVSRTNELADGDVGIFFVDGDMKCKQYCEDSEGNIYLFSLNRARKDADMAILASSGLTVFCFGRVILKRRPPLPRDMGD